MSDRRADGEAGSIADSSWWDTDDIFLSDFTLGAASLHSGVTIAIGERALRFLEGVIERRRSGPYHFDEDMLDVDLYCTNESIRRGFHGRVV